MELLLNSNSFCNSQLRIISTKDIVEGKVKSNGADGQLMSIEIMIKGHKYVLNSKFISSSSVKLDKIETEEGNTAEVFEDIFFYYNTVGRKSNRLKLVK